MVGIGLKNVHFYSFLGLSTDKHVKCYPTTTRRCHLLHLRPVNPQPQPNVQPITGTSELRRLLVM